LSTTPQRQPGELLTYLRILADGSHRSQFFDMRYGLPSRRMRRRYVSVARIEQIAQRIIELAPATDVFVGAALRDRARGDRTAITASQLLYIECDDPLAREHLRRFACSPAMVIASGSPGHLHIYWRLRERISAVEVESANRRLALGLHGELGCADIGRMLRPPHSFNHKHTPPAPVRLLEHDATACYTLPDVLAGLPTDPEPQHERPARPASSHTGRSRLERDLLAIPAADYVRALTGREPNRTGKVLCPFHEENEASLQLYPDGTFYCFGARCKKGGTIFDFAASLWGTGTRAQDFLDLRRRLAATFGPTARPVARSP
jgi:hypothetical protein